MIFVILDAPRKGLQIFFNVQRLSTNMEKVIKLYLERFFPYFSTYYIKITIFSSLYKHILNYFPFVVVVTFLIKTIAQWLSLYTWKSCSCYVLKLLLKTRMFWSNSPSPFAINNCCSPLLSPISITPMMMIVMVINLQF